MEQSGTTESYICTVRKEIIDYLLEGYIKPLYVIIEDPLTSDELKKHINPIMTLPTLDLCPLCGSPVVKMERSDCI